MANTVRCELCDATYWPCAWQHLVVDIDGVMHHHPYARTEAEQWALTFYRWG